MTEKEPQQPQHDTPLPPEQNGKSATCVSTPEEIKATLPEPAAKKPAETAKNTAAESSPDTRSIYVKNVEYRTQPGELKEHFANCGTITRVTVFKDPVTGHPLGYAYLEFAEPEAVEKALKLNDSLFKGRQIKVEHKRKNIPGLGRKKGGGHQKFPRYPMGPPPMLGRGGMRMYPYGGRMGFYGQF